MANDSTAPALLRDALDAYEKCGGNKSEAARLLGLHRVTFTNRYERAVARGIESTQHEKEDFELPPLPSEIPTADQLFERRSQTMARKREAKEARRVIPITIKIAGAVGVCAFGDPHLDDDGTDIDLLRSHVHILNTVKALFGCCVGDYSNNWVGRLARLYGQQSMSAAEAWVLVEWFVRAVPWLFLISGNHDAWSGDGDPIKWIAKTARVQYESHGARVGLRFPNGREVRINARHDFSGRSQYNTAHGPAKAAMFGWRDHILIAGHTHQSGHNVLRDPSSGLISHALRVGSYKTFDRYADEKGLPNQTFTVAPVFVIRPQFADDDTRLITTFYEPETAAQFLTYLRSKKTER